MYVRPFYKANREDNFLQYGQLLHHYHLIYSPSPFFYIQHSIKIKTAKEVEREFEIVLRLFLNAHYTIVLLRNTTTSRDITTSIALPNVYDARPRFAQHFSHIAN